MSQLTVYVLQDVGNWVASGTMFMSTLAVLLWNAIRPIATLGAMEC